MSLYEENYDSLRERLLKEMENIESISDPKLKSLEKDFQRLTELLLFGLISKKDNFFALVVLQMRRKVDISLPAPAAVSFRKTHFDLHLNPLMMLPMSIDEMEAVLIHECYHIFNQHLIRGKKYEGLVNHTIVNIGMDAAINQFIPNLPEGCITLESLANDWKVKTVIEEKRECEYYINLLRDEYNSNEEFRNKVNQQSAPQQGNSQNGSGNSNSNEQEGMSKETDYGKMHDQWKNSDDATFDDVVKGMANEAQAKTRGKIPGEIESLIKSLNEPPIIPWQNVLKRYVGTVPVPYKKTITRRDRRQPHRFDLQGKLNDHQVDIVVAIDTSGSMTDEIISYCMTEVFDIVKHSKATVTIVECDAEVNRVYEAKRPKDVKPDVKGRGGTAFQPVFDWIKENNKKQSIVVYFTDGYGERNLDAKPSCYKTLWVVTEGEHLSLVDPYGDVKYLELDKKWQKQRGN